MMQEEPQYDLNEGFDEAYEQADTERRRIMDPFGDGDREYGGRVRYRSQTELPYKGLLHKRTQSDCRL